MREKKDRKWERRKIENEREERKKMREKKERKWERRKIENEREER